MAELIIGHTPFPPMKTGMLLRSIVESALIADAGSAAGGVSIDPV
jgi:hypothetical protein